MRILVCGTRNFTSKEAILRVLNQVDKGSLVIAGEARGADTIAKILAKDLGLEYLGFPADWNRYGRGAGTIRNQQMLDEGRPNVIYAFYMDQEDRRNSKGTKDMVRRAQKAKLPVTEFIQNHILTNGKEQI